MIKVVSSAGYHIGPKNELAENFSGLLHVDEMFSPCFGMLNNFGKYQVSRIDTKPSMIISTGVTQTDAGERVAVVCHRLCECVSADDQRIMILVVTASFNQPGKMVLSGVDVLNHVTDPNQTEHRFLLRFQKPDGYFIVAWQREGDLSADNVAIFGQPFFQIFTWDGCETLNVAESQEYKFLANSPEPADAQT